MGGHASVRLPVPMQALTWDDGGRRWLLPAALVLEVVRCAAPTPVALPPAASPALLTTLLGSVHWHGRNVPLLWLGADAAEAMPAAPHGREPTAATRMRAVICPLLDAGIGIEAVAFAANGVPSMLLLRDGEPQPEPSAGEPFTAAGLRLGDLRCAVPDLDAIGRALIGLAPALT
jgi:hypothetical protein